MVFAKFRELQQAPRPSCDIYAPGKTCCFRCDHIFTVRRPMTTLSGRPADSARASPSWKNAGAMLAAYVYGRRRLDPLRRQPGSDRIGTAAVAPEDWSICLKDAHPAYLDWDEFMANRRQLADNVGRYDAGRPGAPRKGNALLQS